MGRLCSDLRQAVTTDSSVPGRTVNKLILQRQGVHNVGPRSYKLSRCGIAAERFGGASDAICCLNPFARIVEQALCRACGTTSLEFCGSFQSIVGLQFADA